MSLDHILLGMLDRPAAGYDLGQEFEQSARMFWFAELSQIYPTLRRLEGKGFLTSRREASDRGPDRKVYERTPEGTEELHAWLREPARLRRARLEHVAQLYFLGQLDDLEATLRYLKGLRAELEAQLARFRSIEARHRLECGDPEDVPDDEFHRYATLRAGIRVASARLDWCEETLEALERRLTRRRTAPDEETAEVNSAEKETPPLVR